jgi:parallel beta-helix repeat protein
MAANTLLAGDTVFIREGNYKERLMPQNSGTENNFIVYSGFQDEVVTIDGDTISWGQSWNGLIDISSKSYIEICGLDIINADYAGIFIDNSDHIVIRDNYIYDTYSSGIGVWNSSNVILEGNEVVLACHEGEQECISIANSTNCEIRNNHVHDNGLGTVGGEGIDVKQGSHDVHIYGNHVHHINDRIGIYVDAWDTLTYNIDVFGNSVHHCSNGGITIQSEMGGELKNVNIFNNISYYNKYEGISVGSVTADTNVTETPVKHIKIINNTCFKNGSSAFPNGWGFGILVNNPDAEDIVIRNNICSGNDAQIAIQDILQDWMVDHNLIEGFNGTPFSLFGSDSIIETPFFVDTIAFDFHLQNNSPAIDKGNPLNAPEFDFDNNERPYGNGFDIGAYEHSPEFGIRDSEIRESLVEIYPNPFTDELTVKVNSQVLHNCTLKLFDGSGKLVRIISRKGSTNNTFLVERGNLVPGLYLLNIFSGNQVMVKEKIIIE